MTSSDVAKSCLFAALLLLVLCIWTAFGHLLMWIDETLFHGAGALTGALIVVSLLSVGLMSLRKDNS